MKVGMPQALWLEEFGSQVWSAFGEQPLLVGSSVHVKDWRDVDVRVILDDVKYEAMGFGDPGKCQLNGRWVAMCLAFSALGKAMTGLPVDFQIQQRSHADEHFTGTRIALGMLSLRVGSSE